MFSKSAAVCPHCLRELKLSGMKFYCVPDEDNRHEVKLSFVDKLKGRLPVCKRKFCRNHGLTIREAVCKNCGEPLPPQILFHDKYLSFCAVGVSGAGKSSYMTTLLHELKYSGLPWVLQAMDVDTTQRAQLNEQYVYEERHCLQGTTSGVSPKPQLWTILDNSKKGEKIPTYALTIYDGAGEDCEHIDYTPLDSKISRYLSGAKMLLIMFDPLLLSSVRIEIPHETLNASMATERQTSAPANMVSMVNSLANYIRRNCNIPPGKRIDRRAAVVLTKLDALTEMLNGFASGATILKESPHVQSRAFVQSDSEMVDLEIRDWLTRQGETAFLGAIDANFKDVRVFGVSSFGRPPDMHKRLAKIRPHRVLDPLMWLLAGEGIIPTI
ncbi:MAG: hypothetical protein IJT57_01180 [Selenomonadaceae bacterium]|nr:hypothetical protein [Selenomonadaceae bacterium]MBQ7722911.1 hypothetical protein [Selenomonadaceae bacterium]